MHQSCSRRLQNASYKFQLIKATIRCPIHAQPPQMHYSTAVHDQGLSTYCSTYNLYLMLPLFRTLLPDTGKNHCFPSRSLPCAFNLLIFHRTAEVRPGPQGCGNVCSVAMYFSTIRCRPLDVTAIKVDSRFLTETDHVYEHAIVASLSMF